MSNPTLKLGNSATQVFRDNADNNKTVFTNNSIDIVKLSGTGGQDTIDVTGNINISTNFDINGVTVLDSTSLGASIINSTLTNNTGNLTNTGTINLTTGNDYQINSVSILNATTLGSSVVNSSLTSVGNLTSLTIDGDLTVNGTTTTFNTETLTVEDPLIKMATNNTADTVDTGFFSLYNDGVSKYSGLFRDASDNTFKFFTGTTIEPTTTVDTTAANGYSRGDILVGNIDADTTTITGDLLVDTNTLYVDSTNNQVGIGTTGPTVPLDVVGDINTSTDYNISGTQVLSSTTLGTGVINSSLTSIGTLVQDMNITTGNEYQINSVSVLNATTLGSSVVNSSLTSVGTLTSATISGDLTVDTNTLHVDSANNRVGINTITPSTDFDVQGNAIVSGTLTSLGDFLVSTANSNLSGVLYVEDSTNRVGINNVTPEADLDVVGNAIISGNVGIGITNPTNYFHLSISDDSSNSQLTIHNESGDAKAGLTLNAGDLDFNIQLDGTTTNAIIENKNAGGISLYAKDTGDITFNTTDSDTERLTILNNGNIGINDTTPSYELDVNGDINLTGTLYNNGVTIDASLWTLNGNDVYSTNSGNVGIGNITPAALLHVEISKADTGVDEILRLGWNDAGYDTLAGDGVKISFHTSSVNNALGTTECASISAIRQSGGEASHQTHLIFATKEDSIGNVEERMRIKHNGNIRMSNNLSVGGGGTQFNPTIHLAIGDGNTGLNQQGEDELGIYTGGTERIRIDSTGNVGINATDPSIDLAIGDNDSGFNGSAGEIGIVTDGTERVKVNSGGVNIYTVTSAGSEGLAIRQSATETSNNVFMEFYRSATSTSTGTSEGDIRTDGSGNLVLQNASDRRLKQNINKLENGDEIMKKLRAVTFDWKDENKPNNNYGFIAQEVQEVLPRSVHKRSDGYIGISKDDMIPVMWSALRKTLNEIDELKRKINILEGK